MMPNWMDMALYKNLPQSAVILITQEKLHIVPYLLDKAGTRARQCCTADDKKGALCYVRLVEYPCR
ncbi:unnamed protein product [Rhodiola kirilowii]